MKLLLIFLTSLFAEANAQYADGNYTEAAIQYEQIIAEQPAAEVYYNLGNAYFKQGELAQAILAYERALRLQPSFDDAKHNLLYAQAQIIDNIENTQSFFLSNWIEALRNTLSQRTWTIVSIVLLTKHSGCVRQLSMLVSLLCLYLSLHVPTQVANTKEIHNAPKRL